MGISVTPFSEEQFVTHILPLSTMAPAMAMAPAMVIAMGPAVFLALLLTLVPLCFALLAFVIDLINLAILEMIIILVYFPKPMMTLSLMLKTTTTMSRWATRQVRLTETRWERLKMLHLMSLISWIS